MAYTFNHFFAVVGKSTNSKIESLAKENKFDLNNSIFTSRSFPTYLSNLYFILLDVKTSGTL